MFTKASLRLTGWYVAILMLLSLTFSGWLYSEASKELRAGLNAQLLRPYSNLLPRDEVQAYLNKQFDDSNMRIIGSLALMNVGVLVAGSFISYFLARRTLAPIEQALTAQNRFTADASHELRTPLATIKTELEVALRNKNLSTQEARELLKSNVEEVDRLSKLANDLLVLARCAEKPELKKTSVYTIAQKACDRFASIAQPKQIKIERQIAPVSAMAESAQVDAILNILLDNAVKYSPKRATITVAAHKMNGQVAITVHNTGAQIDDKDLEHVFERFYRTDKSRTGGVQAGHGLGLSIAQKLADSMGGKLAVKSDQTGTTFTLWLHLA